MSKPLTSAQIAALEAAVPASVWAAYVPPPRMRGRPFEETREYARSLGFKNQGTWRTWSKSGSRPEDIPGSPQAYYREWKGWGDWLGTGNVGTKTFRPFEEARAFVHSLGLKNQGDWQAWCPLNKPGDIPANPHKGYRQKWKGWCDWLGTEPRHFPKCTSIRPFEEARKFVRSLGLKGYKEWKDWCVSGKRPPDITCVPHRAYAEWVNWRDWIGAGRLRGGFSQFEDARKFARSLKLESVAAWQSWVKSGAKPENIPSCPSTAYRQKWEGWGDWLGNEKKFRPFEDARTFARSLGLKTIKEWQTWAKSGNRPEDIPRCPESVYQHHQEWKGWGDWLGTGKTKELQPFEEARASARDLGLKNIKEWTTWAKSGTRPPNIPSDPACAYKQKWKGWGDFLGTGNIRAGDRVFRPFKEARAYVRNLHLKSVTEYEYWRKSGKRPQDIPSNPHSVYEEWVCWGDWLGNGRPKRQERTR